MMHFSRIARLLFLVAAVVSVLQVGAQQFGGAATRQVLLDLNGREVKAKQVFLHTHRTPEQCVSLLARLEGLWPKMRVVMEGCSPLMPPPPGYESEALDFDKDLYIEYKDSRLGEHVVRALTFYYLPPEQVRASETCGQLLAVFHTGQASVKCHPPRKR